VCIGGISEDFREYLLKKRQPLNRSFLCASASLRLINNFTLRPLRLCGEIILFRLSECDLLEALQQVITVMRFFIAPAIRPVYRQQVPDTVAFGAFEHLVVVIDE